MNDFDRLQMLEEEETKKTEAIIGELVDSGLLMEDLYRTVSQVADEYDYFIDNENLISITLEALKRLKREEDGK